MATDMGEWTKTVDTTDEIHKICDQVKDQVEKKTGKCYRVYKAVKYRGQYLCGGANFVIKVDVGADYDHLMVFQGAGTQVPTPPSLVDVEQHKNKDDPIVPFNN